MFGQCAYNIVRFVTIHRHHGNPKRLQNALDIGHGIDDVVWRGFTIGLVVLKVRMAECGRTGVKRHRNVCGFFVLDNLIEHIGEAQNGGGV